MYFCRLNRGFWTMYWNSAFQVAFNNTSIIKSIILCGGNHLIFSNFGGSVLDLFNGFLLWKGPEQQIKILINSATSYKHTAAKTLLICRNHSNLISTKFKFCSLHILRVSSKAYCQPNVGLFLLFLFMQTSACKM